MAADARTGDAGTGGETRAVRLAVGTAFAATILQTTVAIVNELTIQSTRLNPDIEGSVFQLLSASVTAAAGLAAILAAALSSGGVRARRALLGGVVLAFALDDVLAIHEAAGETVGERVFGLPAYLAVRLWIALWAPALAVAFVALLVEARFSRRAISGVLVGGIAALVAAVIVEILGAVTRNPSVVEGIGGKPETLRVIVEEGFELGGWWLVAGGLWLVVADERGRPGRRAARSAPPGGESA